MVYERLKKYNLVETNCFKYYDNDCGHKDFRDVLVLKEKDLSVIKGDTVYKDICIPQKIEDKTEIQALFPSVHIDKLKCQDKHTTFSDEEVFNINKSLLDVFQNLKSFKMTIPHKDGFKIEHDLITTQNNAPKDIMSIGFVLEGDYGFVHNNKRSSQHNRNLYKHLMQLRFCDVIVCACSVLSTKCSPLERPINCVIKFIFDVVSTIPITLSMVRSCIFVPDERFWTKLPKEKDVAKRIISQL